MQGLQEKKKQNCKRATENDVAPIRTKKKKNDKNNDHNEISL